jgi:mono/diheme cytochrome c family protein
LTRRKFWLAFLLVMLIVIAGALILASRFNLSALPDPGARETYLATKSKHWLVARAARGTLPPQPAATPATIAAGRMNFMGECANCHGTDGRTPTEAGRWMYPRAPNLASAEVQQWSDAELFWIIKNGIRLSGMPGFGKVLSDTQVWQSVYYVRSLRTPPSPQQ